jgi:AraC-like DNA-binding protein
MGEGLGVWLLEAPGGFGDADFHAHHAIQISITFSGDMALSDGERDLAAPVMAVSADARHRFEAQGVIGFVFVEPESTIGRALSQRLFAAGPLAAIEDAEFAHALAPLAGALDPGLARQDMLAFGRAALSTLADTGEVSLPDARIARIIDHANAHLDRDLNLSAAAAGVYLSESRLRHLFVEQTGLAFKTYVLWLRLVRAVEFYSGGLSLTEAAHAAGFADSAHFSRVFKRTFGLPATTLTRL